jgi:hypothetical protein
VAPMDTQWMFCILKTCTALFMDLEYQGLHLHTQLSNTLNINCLSPNITKVIPIFQTAIKGELRSSMLILTQLQGITDLWVSATLTPSIKHLLLILDLHPLI